MAEYFKEMSKINPVTINQTSLVDIGLKYLTLIPQKNLVNNLNFRSTADYFVINNINPTLKDIYPESVFKETILKIDSTNKENQVLVSVFESNEYLKMKNDAIPIINFLEINNHNKVKVKLPVGKYYIKIKSADNFVSFSNYVDVK